MRIEFALQQPAPRKHRIGVVHAAAIVRLCVFREGKDVLFQRSAHSRAGEQLDAEEVRESVSALPVEQGLQGLHPPGLGEYEPVESPLPGWHEVVSRGFAEGLEVSCSVRVRLDIWEEGSYIEILLQAETSAPERPGAVLQERPVEESDRIR